MVFGSSQTIVINATVEEVFKYLGAFPRHHEWNGAPNFVYAQTSKGPLSLGMEFQSEHHSQSIPNEFGKYVDHSSLRILQVRELVPNVCLAYITDESKDKETVYDRNLHFDWRQGAKTRTWFTRFQLRVADGGCHVTMRNKLMSPGVLDWLMMLLAVAIRPIVKSQSLEARCLKRIKSRMESSNNRKMEYSSNRKWEYWDDDM